MGIHLLQVDNKDRRTTSVDFPSKHLPVQSQHKKQEKNV